MSDWKDRLAARLEVLTRSNGLTPELLAERLGTTPETIAQWLRGDRSPSTPEEYERIARELGMHPAELLYGIDSERIEFAETYDRLSSTQRAAVRRFYMRLRNRSSSLDHTKDDGCLDYH